MMNLVVKSNHFLADSRKPYGSVRCNNSCICCKRRDDDITRNLFVIKGIACEILEKVGRCTSSQTSSKEEVPLLCQVEVSYPITSKEDMKKFEDFIADKEKYNCLVSISHYKRDDRYRYQISKFGFRFY